MPYVNDIDLILYYTDNKNLIPDQKLKYIEYWESTFETPIPLKNSSWIHRGSMEFKKEMYHFKHHNTYYHFLQGRTKDSDGNYKYKEPEIYEVVPQEITTIVYKKKDKE